MAILEAYEISGLSTAYYNSGAVNKLYVDTISGNLDSKIDALGSFNPENYITSSNAISRFADSSSIQTNYLISGVVYNSISSQHISGGYILTNDLTLNANTISGLIDPIYPSAAANKHYVDTVSGSLSTRINALGAFNEEDYITSSNIIANYAKSTNLYNRVWIDTLSGNIDGRLDTLEGYDQFSHENYITSANAFSRFADSSNINSRFIASSTALIKFAGSSAINNKLAGYLISSPMVNKSDGDVLTWDDTNNVWSSQASTGGLEGSTVSSNFFTIGSGNTLWDWFSESGSKLSTISGSLSDRINAMGSFDAENYITSANAINRFVGSGITLNAISSNKISGGEFKGISPITYNMANIRLSANQSLEITKFQCPATKSAYVYQANACASGTQYGISGLYIQMLAGSSFGLTGADNVYKTSSQILQQGNPLGQSSAGEFVKVRLMYSGTQNTLTGIKYGNGMMQIGVY